MTREYDELAAGTVSGLVVLESKWSVWFCGGFSGMVEAVVIGWIGLASGCCGPTPVDDSGTRGGCGTKPLPLPLDCTRPPGAKDESGTAVVCVTVTTDVMVCVVLL